MKGGIDNFDLAFGAICIIGLVAWWAWAPTFDWSDMHSTVKVMEVGKRFNWLAFGEQYYIRVQNAYSDQYSSSSEAWETCISEEQVASFTAIKNSKLTVDIHVVGYGLGSSWNCMAGDRVIS